MNLSLWITPWAYVAAGLVALFLGWAAMAGYGLADMGHGADADFLLWTGWVSFFLYVVVALYSLRKYVHKLGISPEFSWRVSPQQVEAAEAGVNGLRRRAYEGAYSSKKEIQELAATILSEAGVQRVMRVNVTKPEEPAGNRFRVEIVPTDKLGAVAAWMHVHLWGGLAAAVTVALHGGLRFDAENPMGLLLNVLSYVVIGTGIIGIVLWTLGPKWVTQMETDFTMEEAFAFEEDLGAKVAPAIAALADEGQKKIYTPDHEALTAALRAVARSRKDFEQRAGAALQQFHDHKRIDYIGDVIALIGQHHKVRDYSGAMARVKNIMNAWRAIHVPVSIFLMGLVIVHIIQVWWY